LPPRVHSTYAASRSRINGRARALPQELPLDASAFAIIANAVARTLDDIDRRLIAELQADGRKPYATEALFVLAIENHPDEGA
jgi:hypothetical protein